MTDNITNLVPDGIRHDTSLDDLPLAGHMKQHRKILRAIAFNEGIDGVRRYKAKHPEASSIRVEVNTLAYYPKPAGYDDYLIRLATRWLSDDAAADESNKADVERLNAQFGADRFNPANHFSKPLSPGRLRKLKELFCQRGIHLDTDKANTLSKVKAAAKASRGRMSADRPFGNVGVISGNRLVIGGNSLAIMDHHGHEAVKLTVNSKQVWLRLDVLAAAFDLLSGGNETGVNEGNPLLTITLCNIGESVPEPEKHDFDPLDDEQGGESVLASLPEAVESVPASAPASLGDRIAVLKAALDPEPTPVWDGTGTDPLEL
jgi:hypothetical protein